MRAVLRGALLRLTIVEMLKAAVLPVPVWAHAIKSLSETQPESPAPEWRRLGILHDLQSAQQLAGKIKLFEIVQQKLLRNPRLSWVAHHRRGDSIPMHSCRRFIVVNRIRM